MIKEEKKTGAEKIRWNLKDLFSGIKDPHIKKQLKKVKKDSQKFVQKYKGKLAELNSTDLLKAYQDMEFILKPAHKVSQYIHLVFSTDTSNDEVKTLMSEIDHEQSEIENLLVFFELELADISDDEFKKFKIKLILKEYRYELEMLRKNAKYNLSEKEEKVMNLKDLTGENAFKKLYDELTASFQFEMEIDGEKKKMNGSELRSLRHHDNPDIRRTAMRTFYQRYEDNKIIFQNVFNSIVKDYNVERNLRGYKSAISVRNVQNDLSDKAVQVLHDVTTESNKLVHKYYKIKSKILNLPDLCLADIYAPLPKCSNVYSWQDAKEIVLSGFSDFDDEFYQKANLMFEKKLIDAPVKPNKTGGAYCSSSLPELNPYVLTNFLGKQRDVSTLAHELGHAIHSMFCSVQNLTSFHPILPLAETASIFSEMIITDLMLKTEKDKQVKISLICNKLEDIFASSHRQNMFSRFEINSHKRINKSQMSSLELCELYNQELKLMFGDSVRYTPEYQWEWTTIPHIFEWPFYVYAYNFANLLVIAIYERYLEEGPAFIPKYKKFLSMGSSASPGEIMKILDVDITKASFWEKSITYIEDLIFKLEKLVSE